MKKIYFGLAAGILLISCVNKQTKLPSDNMAKIMIPQSSCYASSSKKDTIFLKLEIFPNTVTGILKYNFFEKDKNQGIIEGKLIEDKIFADYTFTSEGKKSVRELAFLIKGKEIIEGIGAMKEENGKLIFKDHNMIDFTNGIKFSPINCAENDKKFQIK